MRRATMVAGVLAVVFLAALPASAATKDVSIMGFAFNPSSLSIHVGDTVKWTNNEGLGGATHTVTSDDGPFSSGNVAPGHTYSFTFTSAGTYGYHCSIHTYMTGTIHVTSVTVSPTPTHTSTPTPTPTHTRPKPTATATAKPLVVPVSPTPTSSVKPSPRVSRTVSSPPATATPTRRVVAAASSSPSQTGVTIGLIAGALVILIGGGLLVVRRHRTDP